MTTTLDRAPAHGLPAPVDDVEQGLQNLSEHGLTIHRRFLTQDLTARLLERVIEQGEMEQRLGLAILGGPGGPQDLLESRPGDTREHIFQLVEFLPNKGRIFIDLAMNALAKAYASSVLRGWPYRMWAFAANITRRGLARQHAHIDQIGIPPEMCTMPAMLNIFLCLSDFEVAMGATLLAPGTHRLPRPKAGTADDQRTYFPAVAKAGDAIIWEGRTWHGAGPHHSDRTRYAISTGYGLSAATPQDVYTSALHDDVYETLSPGELAMFGFRVETAGYSGRLAPRNPFDRRTNVNRATPFVPELHRP